MNERGFKEILAEFIAAHEELNQTSFGKKVGIDKGHVSDWISGKAKPGYDALRRIALAFPATPVEYWLGLDDCF